jgi:checkpoint serine/threonine-protein kinase
MKEADAIYSLGIARRAEPQNRLKKRRNEFQARMLLAPPQAASSELEPLTAIRPVLGADTSARAPLALSQGAARGPLPDNGAAAFAVFSDTGAAPSTGDGSGTWDDLGTVASRRRENVRAAVPWAGETLPCDGEVAALRSSQRVEVFRDDVRERQTASADARQNAPASSTATAAPTDVFSRSIRGPSEAELLRQNPFRLYTTPVELGPLAPAPMPVDRAAPAPAKPRSRDTTSQSSSTSSTATTRPKSASAAPSQPRDAVVQKVALPLKDIFPADEPGAEYSIDELMAIRRGVHSRDGVVQQRRWAVAEWAIEAVASRGALRSVTPS